MRVGNRARTVLVLALSLAAVAALGAGAAGAGRGALATAQWQRISGPGNTGAQIGLARTADGTLHVIWNRGNPAPTKISDTRFSAAGKKLGTTTVATNFGGAGGLALLVMPDKTLRLFATGAPKTGSTAGGVNTFTASANGAGWKLDQGAVWGGQPANAASTLGAALTKDGQPVTGWGGVFQVGITSGIGTTVCACFTLQGNLATDAGSGAVVMSGLTGGKPAGTYVERALPAVGGRVVLPSATVWSGYSGISGRLGAPGVYVMYSNNTLAGVKKPSVRLYRYGGGTRTIANGQFSIAKPFAGPQGRLWLVWGDAPDGVYVTRTSRSVGRLEPVQRLKSPPGAGSLSDAEAEGSQGPLDLFVDADAGGVGFWHAHVLAKDTLRASVGRTKGARKVIFSLTDAGDPVAGATLVVRGAGGAKQLKTDSAGHAAVAARPGRVVATATAAGYAKVSASVTVT